MRVLRTAAATVAAAVSLVAGAITPASAAPSGYNRCPSGKLCLFDGANGTGTMVAYSGPQASSLGTFDNRTSSVWNRTDYPHTFFYRNTAFGPKLDNAAFTMSKPDPQQEDLADYVDGTGKINNSISSFRLCRSWNECLTGHEYQEWYSGMTSGPPRREQPFGDLNRDGWTDLLFRSVTGRLYFQDGRGHGTLIGGGWNAMTALARHGDLTGDGNEDLLARDHDGTLWNYPGDGHGAFGSRVRVGGGWNAMNKITATGDLDGDGHGDLVAADAGGILWLYPGTGRGGFASRVTVGGGWNAVNALAGVGDFTHDAKNDLIARDTTGRLWLYPGRGDGTFGARKLIGSGGWQKYWSLFGVGDADYDGQNELFAKSGHELYSYAGTPQGTLGTPGVTATGTEPAEVFL